MDLQRIHSILNNKEMLSALKEGETIVIGIDEMEYMGKYLYKSLKAKYDKEEGGSAFWSGNIYRRYIWPLFLLFYMHLLLLWSYCPLTSPRPEPNGADLPWNGTKIF